MTAVATKPAAPSSKQPVKILSIGLVPLDKIDATSPNIRKNFDPTKLKELTDSIRQHGVNSAILLRPSEKEGRYELIAGARRMRAAQDIGLKEIPAIVKDYTGDRAPLAQAIENLQREDLGIIEQARGFKALMDASEYTVDQLAQQIDKSIAYVYRAVALLELDSPVVKAIEDGRLTPAHGHQILRVTAKDRGRVSSWALQKNHEGVYPTAKSLQQRVEHELGSNLENAVFPKNKDYAGQMACTKCPYNTGNQGMLFDGAEKGTCTNTQCFDTKTEQAEEDELAAIRKKYPAAKFVERVQGWISTGHSEVKNYLVQSPLSDAKPKGDYALILGARDGVLYYAVPAKPKPEPREVAEAAKPADPKAAFVAEAQRLAVMRAAGRAAGKLKVTREDWAKLAIKAFDDLPTPMLAEILGCGEDDITMEKIEKAPEVTLRAIVALNCKLPYNPGKADFKKLGVDVAAVEKKAKTEALAAWADQEAAAGKKGTTAK